MHTPQRAQIRHCTPTRRWRDAWARRRCGQRRRADLAREERWGLQRPMRAGREGKRASRALCCQKSCDANHSRCSAFILPNERSTNLVEAASCVKAIDRPIYHLHELLSYLYHRCPRDDNIQQCQLQPFCRTLPTKEQIEFTNIRIDLKWPDRLRSEF